MNVRDSFEYQMAMDVAKQRDGHVCQICGAPGNEGHHIVPIRVSPQRACDHDNIVTLCHECHVIEDRKTYHR